MYKKIDAKDINKSGVNYIINYQLPASRNPTGGKGWYIIVDASAIGKSSVERIEVNNIIDCDINCSIFCFRHCCKWQKRCKTAIKFIN